MGGVGLGLVGCPQGNPYLLTSLRTGCWSPLRKCALFRISGRKRPLSGTQHNFHETKRETPKRARPQVVTNRDNRLTDTSERGRKQKGSLNSEHTVILGVKSICTFKSRSTGCLECARKPTTTLWYKDYADKSTTNSFFFLPDERKLLYSFLSNYAIFLFNKIY